VLLCVRADSVNGLEVMLGKLLAVAGQAEVLTMMGILSDIFAKGSFLKGGEICIQ
jgi:hypothetical protein